MPASRRVISPCSSNSHNSLPYDRHHCPSASCDSYWKRTAMRLPSKAHRSLRRAYSRSRAHLSVRSPTISAAAGDEGVAVAPDRVLGVGEGDLVGITGVPGVLGGLDLLGRGLT